MIDPVQVLWSPAGATMPALGSRPLVDVHDGDTPNFRMPIRMLSVDTPEVTAETPEGAAQVDQNFGQLAEWIRQGVAPITPGLAEFVLPKLETGKAGSLQFEQGTAAKEFNEKNINDRLARPGKPPRNLFIRMADSPFDPNHRLLAYIAPNYSPKELATLSREERATFNLDLITKAGHRRSSSTLHSRRARPSDHAGGGREGRGGQARHLGEVHHAAGLRVPRARGPLLGDEEEGGGGQEAPAERPVLLAGAVLRGYADPGPPRAGGLVPCRPRLPAVALAPGRLRGRGPAQPDAVAEARGRQLGRGSSPRA